jgi:hypothetical protein
MTDKSRKRPKRIKYKKPRPISKDYSSLFTVTLNSYLESRFLINVGNIPSSLATLDPAAKRPMTLTALAEHCVDVENAVRAILKAKQQQDCFDGMLMELAGHPVNPAFSLGLRVEVIQKVGREFDRRHLAPYRYFVRKKK